MKFKNNCPQMIEEIIIKWKLNRSLLADKMDMPKGTFNQKVNPEHTAKFTDKEAFRLKMILSELREELEPLDAGFNEAVALIVRKKD